MRIFAVLMIVGLLIWGGIRAWKSTDKLKAPSELLRGSEEVVPASEILGADPQLVALEEKLAQAEKRLEDARVREDQERKEATRPPLPERPEREIVLHRFENRQAPPSESFAQLFTETVFVDETTNTVAVEVEGLERVAKIAGFLRELDRPALRNQYEIEAVLVSARISQGDDFSIEWLAKYSSPALRSLTGEVGLGPGTVLASSDWFDVAITKARTEGRLAILSRPRLILAPGETATISAGREIPLPVANAQDGNVQTSVEFRRVALELEVTLNEINRDEVVIAVRQVNEQIAGSAQIGDAEVPQLSSQKWETGIRPEFGRWYALGGVVTASRDKIERKGWIFRNQRSRSKEADQVGMFLRVIPVIPEDPPDGITDVEAAGNPVFVAQPILRAVPVDSK